MKIGILGGGQLGRMLALAGHRLGMSFRVWEPNPDAGTRLISETFARPFEDADAALAFARGLDAVTLEWENIPAELVARLASLVPTRPGAEALSTAQDRWSEKSLFQSLGIAVPPVAKVDSLGDLHAAAAKVGLPMVVKTRRMGYDGKGQAVVRSAAEIDGAWSELTDNGRRVVPMIAEGFVRFTRELSIIGVRALDGGMRFYPLTENHHRAGILRLSISPAPGASAALQSQAERALGEVMTSLGYVGVMAMELFEVDGQLMANEIAPRVHNSGHWTIDACATSQFENHLRAVTGLPLGEPGATGFSAMVNIVGSMPALSELTGVNGARVHSYDKSPRPGRKVGHVNFVEPTFEALQARLADLQTKNLPGIEIPSRS
ncbi:MAG: 5-(carboxyamino)imidazole ribonucleotide synthase [Phycisphaerales bacterium]|nr:5-(carboxyamino)imidazole ribonucleotide synthase [Phycisphaerales bacterium]